ncbi:hypothetical protein NK214_10505 [Chromobacterium sp. S0633]|uniref:hypothetical protein n=1 Tax=unclassified Chromobacterium TaxID=2641838 RepID=UPI0009E21CFE|nr:MULTISPECIES: hypothetical protein [unclassified Chromobacterium]MCP1290620.1 hypothetical protein [Chromobacterium sp. S0633]PTU66135.1 hypothetical protein DB032_14975 [Chromobacterium sp. Panama]
MAHQVLLNLSEKIILHKDVEIEVKVDSTRLGKLLISKGNIEWLPSGNSVNKHRLSWTKFAQLMETQGKPTKVK